jgi:glutathione S-transferase kappa 1
MIYVKQHCSRERYEETFIMLWKCIFEQHIDISEPENMTKALREYFSDKEVQDVMEAASRPRYKQALTQNTQKAVELGAFGAPFFWVHNKEGEQEPFFGSDRFHFMWQYLGIPWSDIAISEKAKL